MISYNKVDGVYKVKLSRLEMLAILAEDIISTLNYEKDMHDELGESYKHDRKLLKRICKSVLTGYSDGKYIKAGSFSSLDIKSGETGMELYVEFIPHRDYEFDSENDGMDIVVFDDKTDEILYQSLWDVELLFAEGILKEKNER